ncbi:hypothetical protein COL26b_006526 [Colletotrichum chrysophilum]|uniref:uncharacterized protein n=1 Tax=Colletotrichum chrysophilum TaxID=1836956 RepID=UPI0023001BF3|nr:uncharacterized protein COL26b_006526 [Colletotrichum chrysophilum]KAJ0375315.1 hypothetical protein COL26b_006526 [Colletotrichum chrysophilum]
MNSTVFLGLLASAATAAAATIPSDEVPLIGPSFLSNFDPTNARSVLNATESFPAIIDTLFESDVLNKTDLVFTVDVFSAATNKSLYSYFHAGDEGKQGLTAGVLNDQTIGRIGSVSKLFTVYAIIAKAGIEVFSHPVTKYLPELLGNSSGDPLKHVRWEDITVGALAAQQAGSGGASNLFTYMRDNKRPVVSPFRNAVYSDSGFALLGQVLARLSNQTYEDAVRDILANPLGLNSTTASVPKGTEVNAINRALFTDVTSYGLDVPIVYPSGGIYSNAADLRTLGLSILNSELLSPATTSQWMKPFSGTGTLIELVGAPWEITRLAIPATPGSNRTRISDLYIKAGGNGDYGCIFALSPDHGIGFSILVAGITSGAARWVIRDIIGELFIPAAEAAAAENAKQNIAGIFETPDGRNITLTIDDGHPGLGIQSASLESLAGGSMRLYPSGMYSSSRSLSALYNTKGTFRAALRGIMYGVPFPARAASEGGTGGLFDNQYSWMDIGFVDGEDEFILTIEDGKAMSVEAAIGGEQMTFERVESQLFTH